MKGPTLRQRQQVEAENARWPKALKELPPEQWPPLVKSDDQRPVRMLRSRDFIVLLFDDRSGLRLSVCRTVWGKGERFADGIAWDDLQRLKAEAGYGDRWAVEIYPPDERVVNDANMRHLWLLDEAPGCGWKRGGSAPEQEAQPC